jgi:PKD repeat protein
MIIVRKNHILCCIVFAAIILVCIGYVSASDANISDHDERNSIKNVTSNISTSDQANQEKLAAMRIERRSAIQKSFADQEKFHDKISQEISEREKQLTEAFLKDNDTNDISDQVSGFIVTDPSSVNNVLSVKTAGDPTSTQSQITDQPVNQIPKGGYVEYRSDGRTRIFSQEGTQISYLVDDQADIATTPSGKDMTVTHIFDVPDGAIIIPSGNKDYIIKDGEILLTIIDQSVNENTVNPDYPLEKGLSWVEYAESDAYSNLGEFYSSWMIPESPSLLSPNSQPPNVAIYANILFNGIEPSDGSAIYQPVTAFDYYEHSLAHSRTDPAILDRWTGAAWYCHPVGTTDVCEHSPPISFSVGNFATGQTIYMADSTPPGYSVSLGNINTLTYTGISVQETQSSARAVEVYEWGPTAAGGAQPLNTQKVGTTIFSNIQAWSTDFGNPPLSLNWQNPGSINKKDHTSTTGLDVQFLPSSVSPSQIILYTEDLTAGFAADVISGTTPLTVTFTDQSTGNPTGWAWDFNNDGIVDSTTQDSEYTYTRGGTYTVKLTVTRPGQSDDEIKNGYIVVNGLAVRPLPGCANPPTDPDHDGLYEDLNGNGRKDVGDVVVFVDNLIWVRTYEPIRAFDFNNNARIDTGDPIVLMDEM